MNREPIARSATSSATCGCAVAAKPEAAGHRPVFSTVTRRWRAMPSYRASCWSSNAGSGRHPSRDARTAGAPQEHRNPIALPNAGRLSKPRGRQSGASHRGGRRQGLARGRRRRSRRCTPTSSTIVDGASARDIAVLLARVRRAVQERFGVELQLEVSPRGRVRLMQPR